MSEKAPIIFYDRHNNKIIFNPLRLHGNQNLSHFAQQILIHIAGR